jgi:hypothetical protein
MFGLGRAREHHGRYYLLPGMGRSNRRHRRRVFRWSIIFGIVFSALFGCLLYFLNR